MANYISNNAKIGSTLRTLAVTGMVASLAAFALGSTGRASAAELEVVYAHVGFPGATTIIAANPTGGLITRPVEIVLAQDGKILKEYKDNIGLDGAFTVDMSGLSDGIYQLWVKNPRYLAVGEEVDYEGGVGKADLGAMIAGDADNNNVVTVSDFMIVRGSFGKQPGDAGYDERADMNFDNHVDIKDINLMRNSQGLAGAPRPGGE